MINSSSTDQDSALCALRASVSGTWRYCKAAYRDNSKIKPDIVFVNVKGALLERHPEGRPPLLVAAGGESPHAAAVWEYAARDRGGYHHQKDR